MLHRQSVEAFNGWRKCFGRRTMLHVRKWKGGSFAYGTKCEIDGFFAKMMDVFVYLGVFGVGVV